MFGFTRENESNFVDVFFHALITYIFKWIEIAVMNCVH